MAHPELLLLRNYKECIVSHSARTEDFDRNFYAQTQGSRNGILDYIGCLEIYESWRGKKALIYYEDLIRDPEPELIRVLELLGVDKNNLRELINNMDVHKRQSIGLYKGTGGHVSFTKGDPDKLLFHSQNLKL